MKRLIVCPGGIQSANDNDYHYISATQLACLLGFNLNEQRDYRVHICKDVNEEHTLLRQLIMGDSLFFIRPQHSPNRYDQLRVELKQWIRE